MKRIALGLMLIIALSAISFMDIACGPKSSVSAKKAAPVQIAHTAAAQTAIVTEKVNPVKESVGRVPDAEVFNVWKPVQTFAGYRTVEKPPNIYS